MSAWSKLARLGIGAVVAIAILVAAFALLPRYANTRGAPEAEVQRTLPGDELVERAPGDMTHGATIDASPAQVWPWIAQIGDDRGGFYSYTFIENPLQKAMMGGEAVYRNADRVLPEFQDPQPGEGLIADSLRVHSVEPGKYLLATQESASGGYDWVWLWHLEPVGTTQTRLLVRNVLRLSPEGGNPALSSVMGLGADVMEWRMIQGIRVRAEGGREPAGVEAIEIVLWVVALAVGLGAAVLFVGRRAWPAPLLLGVVSLCALIWFTFWLPAIWLRGLLDIVLIGLLWWVARQGRWAARPDQVAQ